MDIYKLKFTRLQNEIFRLLCIKAGLVLNQREIAKNLGVSSTAVSKAIDSLEKEDLIQVERSEKMNLLSIRFKREQSKAITFKRIENLKLIYESNLLKKLEDKFPGCLIILFGSYSFGEDTYQSDIDIAIIGSKRKQIDLSASEKLLERKIFIHCYKSINFVNKNLRSNLFNGINLQGMIEI
ncbi:MAG: nucleotidyltransferase domain-containing protein [Nanoarchaeota archaeon]|nr:nucleotidyltransferase domain-containing protein [Nanoarchaeota archaeon]